MRTIIPLLVCLLGLTTQPLCGQTVDDRVDCQRYWQDMAALGLAVLNPHRATPSALPLDPLVSAPGVLTANSPDVLIVEGDTSQSENSVFVDPDDTARVLNSNNSTDEPRGGGRTTLNGADAITSQDRGVSWKGNISGAGGSNSGDPAAAIGTNGRWFVGYISATFGQGVSFSDDRGGSWTSVGIAEAGGGLGVLDKNHLWIDNAPSSPFQGNLYAAWTPIGTTRNDLQIELVRSTDNGASWSAPLSISNAVNAGSHNQGVHLQTGPNGEVYATWAIYDSWPSDEGGIGFAVSTDGGATFQPAQRIIDNIKGIRFTGTSKDMRVNSFPVMAVDTSNGPNRGHIYIVWTNVGVPGQNTGNDIDVYLIRSTDGGNTWSSPIVVNQDQETQSNEQYLPWITCDPAHGNLHVIFYDDRDVPDAGQVQTFVANSFDGGLSWSDLRVSDVAFSPVPIPGLSSGYFGDYLGITARSGIVYPIWTDNRSGTALAYTSPFAVGCVDDLALEDISVGIGETRTYQVNSTVSAAGNGSDFLVEGNGSQGGTVTITAGVYVDLLPGFSAEEGAFFDASIGDCPAPEAFPTPSSTQIALQELANELGGEQQAAEGELTTPTIHPFPNPTRDGRFSVDLSAWGDVTIKQGHVSLQVMDLLGNVVFRMDKVRERTITVDIGQHPPMVYLLRLSVEGKETQVRKIVYHR